MKRDMDLVRLLLLRLESLSDEPHSILVLNPAKFDVEGYTADQVDYHLYLLVDSRLVDQGGSGVMSGFAFKQLTWAGHDFLDAVRDDEIWRRTREGVRAAGGFSIELLGDLAKGLIRKKIAEHTGVQL
ncbi:hypothetical protein CF98_00160 [Halopseudomonas bauzanensis]|nr:hypothetical protein CF98_00160 [Halopseudomonas bauzanensis]